MTGIEVGVTSIITVATGMIAYLFKRQTNTYTKQETEDHIEAKLLPIIVELQQNKEARKENTREVKSLNMAITDLRIELASRRV